MAARAILAVALLLTLVAGSIAWPAAASGPLCTLSCCAGKAPHAAGSCMHGSCVSNVSARKPASNSSQHDHHHHEQQPAEESNSSGAFPGIMASVGGSDMGEVPTIEATPYELPANEDALTDTGGPSSNKSNGPVISATVISKPCQYDCGACAAGFAAPKRSRNAAALTGRGLAQPPSAVRLPAAKHHLLNISSALGRQSVPRGPPPVSFF
jgi:hypothetical protein